MSGAPTPQLQTKRCIACKQEIPVGASLCSVCKSYQRPWRYHLQYFGPMFAGLAALILLFINGVLGSGEPGAFFSGSGAMTSTLSPRTP
jgi:hypothetical protein